MITSSKQAIAQALAPSGFAVQHEDDDLYFVRPSDVDDVFERVELAFAGKQNEVIVLGMALAVVQSVEAQFRGLIETGGLEELCTDPENGRVDLSSSAELASWIERLATIAPTRVSAFAQERGEGLLERTRTAREAARRAYGQCFETAVIGKSLSDRQREIVENVAARPFAIGSEELRAEYDAAIKSLVLAGDEDVLQLGQGAFTEPDRSGLLRALRTVPDAPMWKIRIVVDLILRKRNQLAGV